MLETCTRCGMVWEVFSTRKNHELCESCRARKRQKVNQCIVWHGHFDEDMVTPVDEDGLQVLPGIRTCNNSDCVSPAHVKSLRQ